MPVKLETDRLMVLPLTYQQILMYIRQDYSLETEFELAKTPRIISPELARAFEKVILPAVGASPDNYYFCTIWTIINKEKTEMVGDLCFKGPPNKRGEIEIGYGTYEQFRSKRYMTEAVNAVSHWAFAQENVKTILAETHKTNLASHKILEGNNFQKFKETKEMIWWKLEKDELSFGTVLKPV